MKKSEINFNIEKFRVLAAVMVITIHSSSFILSGNQADFKYYFIRKICDFGVMFFFSIAGFFLANKTNDQILGLIKKTFKLYIFSSISLIFLNILSAVLNKFLLNEPLKKGIGIVLSRINLTSIISGQFGSFHFWFFSSLLISYVFFYVIKKANISGMSMIFISIGIYIFSLFQIVDLKQLAIYGGAPKAILLMAIGQYIFFYSKSYHFSLLYVFLFIILSGLTARDYAGISDVFLFISIWFTLVFCKYHIGTQNILSNQGSNTLAIYIFHTFFIQIISILYDFFKIDKTISPYFFVSICILVSILLSPILYKSLWKIYDKLTSFFLLEEVL